MNRLIAFGVDGSLGLLGLVAIGWIIAGIFWVCDNIDKCKNWLVTLVSRVFLAIGIPSFVFMMTYLILSLGDFIVVIINAIFHLNIPTLHFK